MTIAALKHKLASHTGTAAEDIVRLTLLDSTGAIVARLDGNRKQQQRRRSLNDQARLFFP